MNKSRFRCGEVIVGYGSTGPYGEPLVHYLAKKPVTVVQVNPMHTKRVKEINDNSPLKMDDKDLRVLADIILLDMWQLCHSQESYMGTKSLESGFLMASK